MTARSRWDPAQPFASPSEVQALNQSPLGSLRDRALAVGDEIARVFEIVEARGVAGSHRIHFVGDVTDVSVATVN